MKQLKLPMPGLWTFVQCTWKNGKQIRVYESPSQTLKLFEGKTSWVDARNQEWLLTGPDWGTPVLKTAI